MAQIGGIKTNELALLYLPQVSADGITIGCVEALVRQNDPVRGRVGAADVLSQLGSPELLEELDWWVIERACRDALCWPSINVSINISSTQFHKHGFAERALALIDSTGIARSRVELEIVEAAFIHDFEMACANLGALRKAGVKIALDDFGTGYSSLTYLLRIPVDKVKIDRTVISSVDQVQSAAIIHAIVSLSRPVGLTVTAEGVETLKQFHFLRSAGCHYMQGYLFSTAASVDGVSMMLEQRKSIISAA